MKKKGFTLVELLGVILILSLLALLITPIVTGIIRSSRSKSYEAQKTLVIEAARLWLSENDSKLSDVTGSVYNLYLSELKSAGLLDNKDIVNIEKEIIIENACVKITTNEAKYGYEFVEDCST